MADPLPLPDPADLDADYNDSGRIVAVGYTADHMRAHAAAERRAALLEAAELCDQRSKRQGTMGRALALTEFANELRERANG